jgi:protein TonB
MADSPPDFPVNFATANRISRNRWDITGGALTLALHVLAIAALLYGAQRISPVEVEPQSVDIDIISPVAELTEARSVIQPKMVHLAQPVVTAPDIEIEPEPSPITVTTDLAPASLDTGNGNSERGRSDYVGRIHDHLKRFMHFPGAAGLVTLRFFVDKAGMVHSLAVMKSSGKKAVDNEAMAMVIRAQPLPPVPDELKVELFGASLPVNYEFTRTSSRRLNGR